ncbi:sugar lyase [Pedobacter sp. HDW13]|uniref:polysaccharide lyase family 8 super-sandwich domain-containing protein n=1 Tax=Pedobacter sp. HDW13 TaxID=2714940 RepID=UPI0014099F63|nr:polysaccharide lyase family 8 super-sandwich domain-containing protein [Pedobacter sp. HDW13]QIL38342.1 sugar lyase [Pedobacter sp. HDW13]
MVIESMPARILVNVIGILLLSFTCTIAASGQESADESIGRLRLEYAQEASLEKKTKLADSGLLFLGLLDDRGIFKDKIEYENHIHATKLLEKAGFEDQQRMGFFLAANMNRLHAISGQFKSNQGSIPEKFWKAIEHYGTLELSRLNDKHRFHASCFAIPQAACGIYFTLFKAMEEVEKSEQANPVIQQANAILKKLAMQSWTQPYRGDDTDKDVVQVERFRNHVWWVGGNALAYRPLLKTAMMVKSTRMAEVVAEVAKRSLSNVSQSTYNEAFWIEGFTADGAGWGHGFQSLVWGYPIHGGISALGILNMLKGSYWAKQLDRENADAILNFLRGSSFYYYKGFIPPCLDRYSTVYFQEKSYHIPYLEMLQSCLQNWPGIFSQEQLKELKQLEVEVLRNDIRMQNFTQGDYSGTRWFYNNDDLVKNTKDYYVMVNMASNRCDGLESAKDFADEYNFFANDGLTFYQKNGNEYRKIIGAMDITATPGVTAREGAEKLKPVTNWRGYCSKYNFAGGATFGGENAVGAFIFEKMNAEQKGKITNDGNSVMYGVKAHKGYFIIGDYIIALGAGISNKQPELEGNIRTSIDQTAVSGAPFRFENGKKSVVGNGLQLIPVLKKPIWIGQEGGFSYTVLPGNSSNAYFTSQRKANEWEKRNLVNRNKTGLPTHSNIFRIWIDHGREALNGRYAYAVYAGKGLPAVELPFKIVRNDTLVQCVQSVDQKITEAVFYTPGIEIKAGRIKFSSSAPCVVLIEDRGSSVDVSLSDPKMNTALQRIELTINGTSHVIELPTAKDCGKPARARINIAASTKTNP